MPRDSQAAFGIGVDAQYKRGVLFLDDMEYATPYVVTGTDANISVAVAAAAKCFGVKGLQIDSGDATPAEDDIVKATIKVCYPETDLLVFRARFGFPDVSDTKDLQVSMTIKDGAREYLAAIKYDLEAKKLYYWSAAGAWVEISGYAYDPSDTMWSLLDLSLDMGALSYMAVLWLGDETSLAGLAFQNVGASTERSLTLAITNTALTAAESTIYCDSLYVGEFEEL
jgi:hypothetical protein